MDSDVVRRLADKGQYDILQENDQLVKQKKDKKCFKGFQEGVINFKPTYKYDPGTDDWDTRWVITWTNSSWDWLLRATREARNPNLQVFIRHAPHVCSQHSFGLPLRMSGMHRTQFDHALLDFLSLVIWSRVFWLSLTGNLGKAQRRSKSVLSCDRCRPHSVTFGYC